MKHYLRRFITVLVLALLLTMFIVNVALAAGSTMPQVPDWSDFWVNVVGSGAIVLILVNLLIVYLPADYGAWVKANAGIIVVILSAFCPNVASWVLMKWPTVDPVPWIILYLGVPWLAHQVFYWLQKRAIGKLQPQAPALPPPATPLVQ